MSKAKFAKPTRKESQSRWIAAYVHLDHIEKTGTAPTDLTWKHLSQLTGFDQSTLSKNAEYYSRFVEVKRALICRKAEVDGEILTEEEIEWRASGRAKLKNASARWDKAFEYIRNCGESSLNPDSVKYDKIAAASGISIDKLAHNKDIQKAKAEALAQIEMRIAKEFMGVVEHPTKTALKRTISKLKRTLKADQNQRSNKIQDGVKQEEQFEARLAETVLTAYRKVTYIDKGDPDVVTPIRIEETVLRWKDKNGSYQYADIGRFAFSKRLPGTGQVLHGVHRVYLDSFDESRTQFIRNWLENAHIYKSGIQLASHTSQFNRFLSWLEAKDKSIDLTDYINTITNLNAYLHHLKGRTAKAIKGRRYTPDKKPIGTSHASSTKTALIKVISEGFNVPISRITKDCQVNFKKSSKELAGNAKKKARSKGDLQSTARCLENFIHVVHAYVTGQANLPLVFEFEGVKRYSHGLESASNISPAIRDAALLSESMLVTTWTEIGLEDTPASYLNRINDIEPHKLAMANYAMVAGSALFVINSTHNLSVVLELEMGNLEYVPTLQGYRALGLKARVGNGGKYVYPEVGVRFIPILKKLLEIRAFLLNGGSSKWLWVKSPKARLASTMKQPYKVKPNDLSPKKREDKVRASGFRGLLSELYPEMNYVPSRPARNTMSGIVNDLTGGDIDESAEVLGHTRAVAAKNYLWKAVDDVADEMGSFINGLLNNSLRASLPPETTPVNIVGGDDINFTANPSGNCNEPLNPAPIDGLSNPILEPNCRAFENCFFCKHFAMHADEIDIRKLLSIAYLCDLVKGLTGGDIEEYINHWGLILNRINEILRHLINKHPELEDVVERVRDEVFELERLDGFWEIHLDYLIATGAVL